MKVFIVIRPYFIDIGFVFLITSSHLGLTKRVSLLQLIFIFYCLSNWLFSDQELVWRSSPITVS